MTVVTVAIAIAGVAVAAGQWRVLNETLGQMRNSERPWVVVRYGDTELEQQPPQEEVAVAGVPFNRIKMTTQNVGRSIAINYYGSTSLCLGAYDDTGENPPDPEKCHLPIADRGVSLTPGQVDSWGLWLNNKRIADARDGKQGHQYSTDETRSLFNDDILPINVTPKATLYMMGWYKYDDTQTIPPETRTGMFCMFYRVSRFGNEWEHCVVGDVPDCQFVVVKPTLGMDLSITRTAKDG